MSSLPWYKDGLHFKCTECGKCCTGKSGAVWVSQEEMKMMAASLGISIEAFQEKYTALRNERYTLVEKPAENGNFDCVFLKENKCQIYQARPTQCRTFPWWRENLRTEENWKAAALECEGINDAAPLVSLSEIVKNLLENDF